jgi:small subunit ribosomal protein S18
MRRKRTLDPSIPIDYKKPDTLKRFVTDRGKIIPARISGATSAQQREITLAVKRARYLSLLPCSVSHRTERGFAGEMQLAASSMSVGSRDRMGGPGGDRGGFQPRDQQPAPESNADKNEDGDGEA